MFLKLTIMDLNDKLKGAYEDLKSKAEKLKEKLNLSAEESRKEFDVQIDNMQQWMDDNDINSETFKHKSEEAKVELKTMFEELQLQIALAKADGEDSIKEHSRTINEKIHKIKVEIDKDSRFKEFKKDASSTLAELSDTISILSTKFQYDIEDGKEAWEEKKKEINKEVDNWSDEFKELKDKSSQKIDGISEEASKLWGKIKKSF